MSIEEDPWKGIEAKEDNIEKLEDHWKEIETKEDNIEKLDDPWKEIEANEDNIEKLDDDYNQEKDENNNNNYDRLNNLKTYKEQYDKRSGLSYEDQAYKLSTSYTLYVGNLSFNTTKSIIEEQFNSIGQVEDVILGINRHTARPCGFCFVIQKKVEDAKRAVEELSFSVLDDRKIRVDYDVGFKEGRQYGRGQAGQQVRDEIRDTFDEGRPVDKEHIIQTKNQRYINNKNEDHQHKYLDERKYMNNKRKRDDNEQQDNTLEKEEEDLGEDNPWGSNNYEDNFDKNIEKISDIDDTETEDKTNKKFKTNGDINDEIAINNYNDNIGESYDNEINFKSINEENDEQNENINNM